WKAVARPSGADAVRRVGRALGRARRRTSGPHATLPLSPKPCPLMGHRLSKIYTRTGDGGETGLGDGSRTRKDSPPVVALGEIDELNSAIGVLLAEPVPEKIHGVLEGIQHDLFDLGGDVSIPGRATLSDGQVRRLETLLDEFN